MFAPAETEHGTFVTHAYPYSDGQSTFLIETDEQTWRRAGFEATTEQTPSDASDLSSLRYLQQAFAGQLGGHALIGNRTRWTRFRTVRCQRWSSERTVLLGDAAHTAHYSIGSGTKLAMEDAIALVEAMDAEPDAAGAFSRYEAVRRGPVGRLQELARRSQLWWESFPSRLNVPVEQLMVAYMTRAGNVPLGRFAATNPEVLATALGRYAGLDLADRAAARRHNQLGPGPAAAPPGQAVAGPGARARLVRYPCARHHRRGQRSVGTGGGRRRHPRPPCPPGRGGRVPLHRAGRPPLAADEDGPGRTGPGRGRRPHRHRRTSRIAR